MVGAFGAGVGTGEAGLLREKSAKGQMKVTSSRFLARQGYRLSGSLPFFPSGSSFEGVARSTRSLFTGTRQRVTQTIGRPHGPYTSSSPSPRTDRRAGSGRAHRGRDPGRAGRT